MGPAPGYSSVIKNFPGYGASFKGDNGCFCLAHNAGGKYGGSESDQVLHEVFRGCTGIHSVNDTFAGVGRCGDIRLDSVYGLSKWELRQGRNFLRRHRAWGLDHYYIVLLLDVYRDILGFVWGEEGVLPYGDCNVMLFVLKKVHGTLWSDYDCFKLR